MKKILIADDLTEIRRLLALTLQSEDYQIFQAENGEKAVEIAMSEHPDLIIMDILMPGKLDGLEATRVLKNNPETEDCQIIMLTVKGHDTDRENALKAGANDYFSKPFSPLDLIQKVEEVVEI